MTPVLLALPRGWNLLLALILQIRGRWRLRRGDADGAARFLEAAARRAPHAFGPLLHLSRAHLRRRDLARAWGALARAREASPGRFRREAGSWMRVEGYELTSLTDLGPPSRVEAQGERRTTLLRPPHAVRRALPLGDFRDLDEYTRFRSMPPITRAEIEDADWDAVADDLQDG